jgi:Ig-like domain from next to BRCA1 gene
MLIKKSAWAATVFLLAAALTACNIGSTPQPTVDVNAIFTAAAATMDAQLNDQATQTAAAVSPTPAATFTALPTFPVIPLGTPFSTSAPGGSVLPTTSTGGSTLGSTAVGCDDATYISETKPDDGTQETAGQAFTKGWSLQNTGTCTWNTGYTFAFITGDQMEGKDILISKDSDFTDPGHSQTFIVKLTAPATAGEYKGYWQMKNATGVEFGSRVWVDIVVK